MLRLSLEAPWVLDVIDRQGSFARAAAAMHRVPSAVTYAVRKLEQGLEIALFDRSGHRAALTAAGREVLESGRHLLRAAEDLQSRARRVATGWEAHLAIAVDHLIPAARLLPLVGEFLSIDCGTRLGIQREVFGGTRDALVYGRADLAIGASREGPPGGGYTSRPLGHVDMLFAVAPQHPLANAQEPLSDGSSPKDLTPKRRESR
jgi:DNA-binding transcriptional LysR family regulator